MFLPSRLEDWLCSVRGLGEAVLGSLAAVRVREEAFELVDFGISISHLGLLKPRGRLRV